MKTSHIKTWSFVIILVASTIALSSCKKKEPPQAEQQADAPDSQQQAEAEERDRARAERARARQIKMRQAAAEKEVSSKPEAMVDEIQDIQAERIYQMALVESKIAKKPMMSYARMVNYCRQLLKEFPNTPQAEKARQLLKNMPERKQRQHNVTAEEMATTR